MRKRSGQVHSRESSATLQLTVSLLYRIFRIALLISPNTTIIIINSYEENNRCVLQLMNLEVCVLPTIFI